MIEEIVPNGSFFPYIRQELDRFSYVFDHYYNKKNYLVMLGGKILSFLLKKYDDKNDSSELVCFGYMIKARKGKC